MISNADRAGMIVGSDLPPREIVRILREEGLLLEESHERALAASRREVERQVTRVRRLKSRLARKNRQMAEMQRYLEGRGERIVELLHELERLSG